MKLLKILGMVLLPILILGSNSPKVDSQYYLFIGTYTDTSSEGIYVYKFDTNNGSLTHVSTAKGVKNPSYLAISPDQKKVYSVNQLRGGKMGAVSSFSFNKKSGELTFLNKQSSGGEGPCYVAIDQTGQYIVAANYSSGSFSMLPIAEDGSLQKAKVNIRHHGSSVNENRQQAPHVHCTLPSPDNRFVFVTDLGTDLISQYAFDAASGQLDSKPVQEYQAEPGAGPRHLTFHPSGNFAYAINEINGTIDVFTYQNKRLNKIQHITALPEGYEGAAAGADIHVSPDGNFLYASNRDDFNSIAIFSINTDSGKLKTVDQERNQIAVPRNFMIDPTGNYLLVANQDADNVVVFKRNKTTAKLTLTDHSIDIAMPVCLKMTPVN